MGLFKKLFGRSDTPTPRTQPSTPAAQGTFQHEVRERQPIITAESEHNFIAGKCSRCSAKQPIVELMRIIDKHLSVHSGDYPVQIARAALRSMSVRISCEEPVFLPSHKSQKARLKAFHLDDFLKKIKDRAPNIHERVYGRSSESLEKAFLLTLVEHEENAVTNEVLLGLLGSYTRRHHHDVPKPLASAAARAIVAIGEYEHIDVLKKLLERDPPNRRRHIFEMLNRAIEFKMAGFDFEVSSDDSYWGSDYFLLTYRLARGAVLPPAVEPEADRGRWTGLHFLIQEDDKEFASILLANKSHINDRDFRGLSPLHLAAARQNGSAQVELLLANGADVNARDDTGRSPLHYAVMNKEPDYPVNLLLKKGSDVNARDNSGRTPLHYAMEPSYNRILEVLLKEGATVNARDKDGITPLGSEIKERGSNSYHATFLRQHGGCE